ncbi:hypothetical protein AAVH_41551 [Aphelenchoides avenae]|nr:hypothetical protein AAVH_41551 [Aphelenchus avenae]
MALTPTQMEERGDNLLADAEELRDAADYWRDRAEELRNSYLVSHDRVVGCAATLPETDRRVLREVEHTVVNCPCHEIRTRQLLVRKLELERELKEKTAADKRFREEYRRQQMREDRKNTGNGEQLPTMAARRSSAILRFDPLQAKDAKKPTKVLGEKAQPKAEAPSLLDTILAGQEKTHGAH